MLRRILVDNYTTYINPTVFDFQSKNYKFLKDENVGREKILKGILFLGENASGKTNALKSITILIELISSADEFHVARYKSFYTKNPNYSIEYDFVESGHEIIYSIGFNTENIIKEKLTLDNKTVILRTENLVKYVGENGKLVRKNAKIPGKLAFLRQFYFDTHFYNNKILNEWFNFIRSSIYIRCYDHKIIASPEVSHSLGIRDYLEKEKNGEGQINEFFSKIGYKQDIKYTDRTPKSKNGFIAVMDRKMVTFRKKGTDVFVPIEYESTGNITLINILPSVLYATKNKCFIVIDEFSSGLHNELEESLLKYFFHFAKESQLFFTTHSTNVINNTILRPDQIYSIRFDGKHGSVAKRFSDESTRESQNPEKMYLSGVFDDVPEYKKEF